MCAQHAVLAATTAVRYYRASAEHVARLLQNDPLYVCLVQQQQQGYLEVLYAGHESCVALGNQSSSCVPQSITAAHREHADPNLSISALQTLLCY